MIPGVTFQYGNIQIIAPLAGFNAAEVRINPVTRNVRVGVNGLAEEFPAGEVYNVTYRGGPEGGDVFVNALAVPGVCYGFGGYNDFVGGTAYNFVYLHGNANHYSAAGMSNTVFLNGGREVRVCNPAGCPIVVYP